MTVAVYGAAVLIIVASMVVGRAIGVLIGMPGRLWGAPAVGFAALIVLAAAAIKLPGRAITAAVLLLILIVLAVAVLAHRRVWPGSRAEAAAGLLSILGASLPFVANGRIGLPGISLDNDTSTFLLYTEALRSSRMEQLWSPGNGYPLGPPSVSAVVSSVTGMSLELAFTGLFIAIVVITAMAAAGVLRESADWRRIVLGVFVALAYLAAAYYAEGSFKEPVMALMLLAFVVILDRIRTISPPPPIATCWRMLLAPGLLLVAAIYTYSYIAAAWFAGTLIIWLIAEVVTRPAQLGRLRRWLDREHTIQLGRWTLAAIVVILVLLAPIAAQITSFFGSVGVSAGGSALPAGTLGNLIHPLSGYEAFGVWISQDFRVAPTAVFHGGELSAFAVAVAVFGALWSLRHRDLLLPAAVVACLVIWWRSDGATHPYVAAKALVIAAPLIVALALKGLLGVRTRDPLYRWVGPAVALLFCIAAGYSSYSALRSEPVGATADTDELSAFHAVIGNASVLYLGDDAYAPWALRSASVSALSPSVLSQGQAALRKGAQPGGLLDFDSVDPPDLNHFGYVITSNTPFASQAPPNFHLVERRRLYELWRRAGPTPYRSSLDPLNAPGAILDCSTPAEHALAHSKGTASVTPAPVLQSGLSLLPGTSGAVSLPLPPGHWNISINYVSTFDLHLSTEGHTWTMPAHLGIPGQFFSVGDVIGHGVQSPVTLEVSLPRPSALTGTVAYMSFPTVAATRVPARHRQVPLRQACGRYVDWFRLH